MGPKALIVLTLISTFILVNTEALEEKANKPMPRFIRRLFQKFLERDNRLIKERRAAEDTKSEGWFMNEK